MKSITTLVCLLLVAVCTTPLAAQIKLPFRGNDGSDNLKRLPNDQIEGTIWEYKATPKSKAQDGEKTNELKGKFRMEGKAMFAVKKRISVKGGGPGKLLEKIKSGDEFEVGPPEGPQQKRIGEYRKLSSGKYRLDFDDKDSLHGIMIIWKKDKKSGVYIGTYKEMEGKKTTGEFVVELKPIED